MLEYFWSVIAILVLEEKFFMFNLFVKSQHRLFQLFASRINRDKRCIMRVYLSNQKRN